MSASVPGWEGASLQWAEGLAGCPVPWTLTMVPAAHVPLVLTCLQRLVWWPSY